MKKQALLTAALLITPIAVLANIDLTSPGSDWTPVLAGDQLDPGQDTQATASVDLTGYSDTPLFYMKYDDNGTETDKADDLVAFRFRGDNALDSRGRFTGYIWIGLDVDSDNDLDAFMMLEGKNGYYNVAVYDAGSGANISPSTTDISHDSELVTSGFAFSHAAVSSVDALTNPDIDGDGDADYLISYQVNFNALAAAINSRYLTNSSPAKTISTINGGEGLTIQTPFRVVIASAQNSQTLNGDIGGYNDKTEDLTTSFETKGAFSKPLSFSKPELALNNEATVTITGPLESDETLTASVTDIDGTSTSSFVWQWYRNGVAISGANAGIYPLGDDDAGKNISIKVTFIDDLGNNEAPTDAVSVPGAVVANTPGSVTISGTVERDTTLTATVSDDDGTTTSTITYRWYADGVAISGASGRHYTLTINEVGKRVSVEAIYNDDAGNTENPTDTTDGLVANINTPGSVTISGTVSRGQTLTAHVNDVDGTVHAVIAYQWKADGVEIVGATSETYVLTRDEAGKTISVVAYYVDDSGNNEAPESSTTGIVSNVNTPGSVTIGGSAMQGNTLTAHVSDDDGTSTSNFHYQWYVDGVAISGANSQFYVLTGEDVAKHISVVVTYIDDGGSHESPLSATTAAVISDPARDDDGDGISNGDEGSDDSDGDGIPNYLDLDSDNDGLLDANETDNDKDGDGIPDYLDLDSDNDGIIDLLESGITNPQALDTDNDGRIDSSYNTGSNGLVDLIETGLDSGVVKYPLIDTDGDGVKDFRDLDSDNDGITDATESGSNDNDKDGRVGRGAPIVDPDGLPSDRNGSELDTDGDGIPNYRDLDSDNDGIKDIIEAGGSDDDNDGQIDGFYDDDGDGFDDVIRSTPYDYPDEDGDGIVDFLDLPLPSVNVPAALSISGTAASDETLTATVTDPNGTGTSVMSWQWYLDGVAISGANTATLLLNSTHIGGIISAKVWFADDEGNDENPSDSTSAVQNSENLDSDKDGISDAEEGTGDSDDDSVPNKHDLDSDNDGIPDETEGKVDTDKDGQPDYLDLDSDNDKIPDLKESGISSPDALDKDNDGRIDRRHKVGKNGMADIIETSDDSGVPSFKAIDSDGDGVSDYKVAGNLSMGTVITGRQGLGMGAFSVIPGSDLPAPIQYLLLFSVFTALRRIEMFKKGIKAVTVIAILLVSGHANAGGLNKGTEFYFGGTSGSSFLSPDVSTTAYAINDGSAGSWKIMAGMDFNKKLSIQSYYANLGSVALNPGGSIAYQDTGVSALYYFYQNGRKRGGIKAFAQAGVGKMINSADVVYKRSYDQHVMLGAGVEYNIGKRFALRAEADLFDLDARLISFGIVKRFGGQKSLLGRYKVAMNIPEPKSFDEDRDGVFDREDLCPGTPLNIDVDEKGCRLTVDIALPSVFFDHDSSQLTQAAIGKLEGVINTLRTYPELKIEVAGHTDSKGNDRYNIGLSERRALAVQTYLVSNGIELEQLQLSFHGEAKPVADNNSAEGRAINRRAQFYLVPNEKSVILNAGVEQVDTQELRAFRIVSNI